MGDDLTLKVCYDKHCNKDDGMMPRSELRRAFYELELWPTAKEVEEMIREVDDGGKGIIPFEVFVKLCRWWELRQAFWELCDSGTELLSCARLREMLTTMGDKMQAADVDEVLRI